MALIWTGASFEVNYKTGVIKIGSSEPGQTEITTASFGSLETKINQNTFSIENHIASDAKQSASLRELLDERDLRYHEKMNDLKTSINNLTTAIQNSR